MLNPNVPAWFEIPADDLDRAQRFYELSAQNTSDATIDRSTDEDLKGKPLKDVSGKTSDARMQINRYNVQALGLLMKDRAPEADLIQIVPGYSAVVVRSASKITRPVIEAGVLATISGVPWTTTRPPSAPQTR